MATLTPTRKASRRSMPSQSPRHVMDEAALHTRSSTSADLSVTRLEYAMMSEGVAGVSPTGGSGVGGIHRLRRQTSPPTPASRKAFMDKLLSLSKLHVDEAIGSESDRQYRLAPRIAFSTESSLSGMLDETDVSSTSSSAPEAAQTRSVVPVLPNSPTLPVTTSSLAAAAAPAAVTPIPVDSATEVGNDATAQTATNGSSSTRSIPVVAYLTDLMQRTANMACVGSCIALQLKCEETFDDVVNENGRPPRTRTGSIFPSDDAYSQSYRSTDDAYSEDFDYSLDSTFDETIDDQDTSTYVTGPVQLEGQANIARVSRFDDTTTLSSQNSNWL